MRRTEFLLCVLLPLSAQAAPPAFETLLRKQAHEPVALRADRAEWRGDGGMTYEGQVTVTSGRLSLRGDRVEVSRSTAGQLRAEVTGRPARLTHAAVAPSPAISAEASRLTLDSQANVVELAGDARLRRGAESLDGDRLRYDVLQRRVLGAGRIRMQLPAHTESAP